MVPIIGLVGEVTGAPPISAHKSMESFADICLEIILHVRIEEKDSDHVGDSDPHTSQY
jgi:hypothetical protein